MIIEIHHLDIRSIFERIETDEALKKQFFDARLCFGDDEALVASQMAAVESFAKNGLYAMAGVVEADSLEEAYRLSNHIDGDWTDGPQAASQSEARSSDVLDVFVLPNGEAHLVASIGFRKLPDSAAPLFANDAADDQFKAEPSSKRKLSP